MFSRKRLVFDEFFIFLMSVRLLKDKKVKINKSAYPSVRFLGEYGVGGRAAVPYALTGAQKKVIRGGADADLSEAGICHDPIDSGRRWFG